MHGWREPHLLLRVGGAAHAHVPSLRGPPLTGGLRRAVSTSAPKVFITSKVSPYEQGQDKARVACLDILAKLDTPYVVS